MSFFGATSTVTSFFKYYFTKFFPDFLINNEEPEIESLSFVDKEVFLVHFPVTISMIRVHFCTKLSQNSFFFIAFYLILENNYKF